LIWESILSIQRLAGKYTALTKFEKDDFRNNYFAGDRLERAVNRTNKIKAEIVGTGLTMPQVAIQFALDHPAVSTIIPGIRNVAQAEANCSVSDLPLLSKEMILKLRTHAWNRGFWYGGK
jgi:aryl-alcohol dehydrogenase-like predicted oxidoreductase